jgi:hypothetical protein
MADYSESESAILRGQDGSASNDGGQLDSAGRAILKLLHKAAGTAEANSRSTGHGPKALKPASRCPRSDRPTGGTASAGLRKISMEMEDRLINAPEEKRRQMSRQ